MIRPLFLAEQHINILHRPFWGLLQEKLTGYGYPDLTGDLNLIKQCTYLPVYKSNSTYLFIKYIYYDYS